MSLSKLDIYCKFSKNNLKIVAIIKAKYKIVVYLHWTPLLELLFYYIYNKNLNYIGDLIKEKGIC